jgi:ferredoxin
LRIFELSSEINRINNSLNVIRIIRQIKNIGEIMGRKVAINNEECIGCGSCADMCPDIFEMNHELEKSFVIKAEGGDEDCILDAMGECPMSCIIWDD